jgi:signal transduction histidine kinase
VPIEASDGETPTADGATMVRVGTFDAGIFVEDDGPGIDPEQRETVFEYGMSTADNSGVGLAIVRTVVEAHGWEVDLTESEAGGVRFEFRTGDRHD